MSDVLPIVGVGVGVILSWATSALSERARFRRERTARLQDERLAAYTAFSAAAKESMSILFRVAAGRGLDPQTEPLALTAAEPLLAAAFHARETAAERLRLVGDDSVFEAARTWVRGIYDLRGAVTRDHLERPDWEGLVATTNGHRDRFYALARRDITG